jgi:hypothetical protein
MLNGPLSTRFLAYGLLGVLLETTFTGSASLWMLGVYGAGGLVLDGTDELLRLPRPLRALGLLLCIYALGNLGGWAVHQLGGECPWGYTARSGVLPLGYVRLDHAPLWFGLALAFRSVRRGVDRLQESFASEPAAGNVVVELRRENEMMQEMQPG